jgi:hypothetical protein
MSISSSSSFYPPPQVTSTSPIDHTRQIIALGITERIALFCKTIFQSFLNLFFNYIDKAQLQLQWKEIYQGQKEVTLFPLTQNTSEMQPELAAFCHLYLNSNQKELKASGKGLQVLPESIGNLVNLKCLRLSNNHFNFVPEGLFRLSNNCKISLENNSLSEEEIARVRQRIDQPGYRGPRFIF